MEKILILGKENVGKSSLFNYLTKKNYALVSNIYGQTVDFQEKKIKIENIFVTIIDSKGLSEKLSFDCIILKKYIKNSNYIIYILNANNILKNDEIEYIETLRIFYKKKIILLVNKIDINNITFSNFFKKYTIFYISIKNNQNLEKFKNYLWQQISNFNIINKKIKLKKINIIGKQNSGKSTLMNRLINNFIVKTSSIPGTTIDSINSYMTINKQIFNLFDNPGIEKKQKNILEYCVFSKTYETIKISDLNILVIDQNIGLSNIDIKLIHYVLNNNKKIILVLNKTENNNKKENFKLINDLIKKNLFLKNIDIITISAKYGINLKKLKLLIIKNTTLNNNLINKELINNLIIDINNNEQFKNCKIKNIILIKTNPIIFKIQVSNKTKLNKIKIRFLIKNLISFYNIKNQIVKVLF